ncbi:hypothetical protein [Peteryoungia ipomoeae]|uniref:Uncharacterized protein n=1 Tax=Peteryoungia ipomoeae TaxID=1210932 RepID=A0A4S8PB09_9HYPH|nr:hypothetical protein [Peteryoungia ipomoeae]THV25314.1 hypothetical protein FAA97_03705 [Peteryoungia ipomoeae]
MICTATRFTFARMSGELDGPTDSQSPDCLSSVADDIDASGSTSWLGLGTVIMVMALPFALVAWLFR